MPVSTSTGADQLDQPSSQAATSTALVPLAGADEDEMMQDVAQIAGGAQASGQDALTKLEATLRPIEKYAVRFLELVRFCQLISAALGHGLTTWLVSVQASF